MSGDSDLCEAYDGMKTKPDWRNAPIEDIHSPNNATVY